MNFRTTNLRNWLRQRSLSVDILLALDSPLYHVLIMILPCGLHSSRNRLMRHSWGWAWLHAWSCSHGFMLKGMQTAWELFELPKLALFSMCVYSMHTACVLCVCVLLGTCVPGLDGLMFTNNTRAHLCQGLYLLSLVHHSAPNWFMGVSLACYHLWNSRCTVQCCCGEDRVLPTTPQWPGPETPLWLLCDRLLLSVFTRSPWSSVTVFMWHVIDRMGGGLMRMADVSGIGWCRFGI